jgi:hypothetical protein
MKCYSHLYTNSSEHSAINTLVQLYYLYQLSSFAKEPEVAHVLTWN